MKFDEYAKKCEFEVNGLYETITEQITAVTTTPHVRVWLSDERIPHIDIWDDVVLIGLLRMAAEQGLIDLDKIDINPENMADAIRPLVGCTLRMPIRLDQC